MTSQQEGEEPLARPHFGGEVSGGSVIAGLGDGTDGQALLRDKL